MLQTRQPVSSGENVQKSPPSKAANSMLGPAGQSCLAYPEGEYLCVAARSVHAVREHGKRATCLRVEALQRVNA